MAAAAADGDAPIAAFAVAKGGVVLKHIFLNAPPPEAATTRGRGAEDSEDEEEDPPVMVGRHPDCHVLVDHPSVSRFHLELRCRRRQRLITVTDLCSVHGTWVSGRRIPPNTPVDLATGDTLRLGASKREYRLLWLSLREAFEMDDLMYMPSLPEEDKEEREPHAYKEPNSQLVPGHRDSVGMETHQDTSEQIVSEDITFPAKVAPSAPPLSDFVHPFLAEEPSLSQFHEKIDGVTEEKLVEKNQFSESFGSLIIQEMPGTLTNAGKSIHSDKKDASNKMSKRSKLRSVKSLCVDTGRSRDRSSTLIHSIRKGDQNEILVCSQSCGTECTACIALFGISEVERAEEKEELIAEDKVDMNPPASMIMEGTMKERKPENYIPQDPVDAKLQKKVGLLDSALPLHFKDDAFTDKEIPEWNGATIDTESVLVSENLIMPEMKHDGLNHLNLEGDLSENENMDPNNVAEGPGNCNLEGTICGNLFDNLDTEGIEEDEEICPMDKDEITPNVSGNIIMERSHIGLKPTISQQLMDSISPLNLDHDDFSENENSKLYTGDQMKSNEPVSENLNPLMPISHLEFKDDILLDMENSVPALEKSEAMAVRQENLFSEKENVTPASKVKTNVRRVLGTRMDNSMSAAADSNKKKVLGSRVDNSVSTENSSNKKQCSELSSKSEKFHTVDFDVFYSDKENLTPIASGGMKARKCFPNDLSVDLDQDQEAFCSDKENLTPLSSAARKTRDMSENRARVESAITKKRVADRLPFQTLLSNSPLRPASSHDCTCAVAGPTDITAGDLVIKLEDKFNNLSCNNQESGSAGQGMKTWTMVANTDSLLDDESRKAIMLLKGLKGTRLFIPRIVIRELDSMKQREGLFRRSTKATTILQWIEECMATESWWIHVQSSADMFPVAAPTPPATPSAQRIDEEMEISSSSSTFNPMASFFSPRSSPALADIVSPRPEDRVLDCAILVSRLRRSGEKVVVLSHSVSLKIKAMAEGLPCEGAKEFRESLMDPSSRRFMWAASAPRGAACSCLDASALAENYYNSHHHAMKRSGVVPAAAARPAQAAKGLKLILRHNSLYAQATTETPPLLASALASV
ncbi:FHA domain-containing protein PS1 [Sorghum bicolor]|nr:FHA domain-containing protein PS1 [Sorghum bicolor]|eukprot:XP_021316557.1 FHA domain-containing protein PS1 [Sorghum bicolor]